LAKLVEAGTADTGNVLVETQIRRELNTKHAHMLTWVDSGGFELQRGSRCIQLKTSCSV